MKRSLFRRGFLAAICLLTALCLIGAPRVYAEGDGTYAADIGSNVQYDKYPYAKETKVRIVITVTKDANKWKNGELKLYSKDKSGTEKTDSKDIKSNIDDSGDVSDVTFNIGDRYPDRVSVYTKFGGNLSKQNFEGEVKIYVNGRLVSATNIDASAGRLSTTSKTSYIYIDKNKVPDQFWS